MKSRSLGEHYLFSSRRKIDKVVDAVDSSFPACNLLMTPSLPYECIPPSVPSLASNFLLSTLFFHHRNVIHQLSTQHLALV
jgi:hypothetical protein